mmetsp:Transcript_20684/g.33523  ORF Transcript_20684/g.33523 Transcript_20684/m.33523 type:complete len:254 (+) Transcript_20684:237-998(+)
MTAETSRAVPNGNGDGPELIRVVPRAVLSAEETVEEAVARRLAFFADQMVDEAAMLAASTFPISPEALIAKTKGILATNNAANDPSRLAADFHFVAPVVGPLPKEKFLEAFASFKLEDAFPDAKFNYHSFRVDPFEPNRVWYDSRFVGTHTGLLAGRIKATNILVKSPPQACSMLFNEAGECTQLTVGYVMDKQIGNNGGLGGVFGILYAIGSPLPFPEGRPWRASFRYAFLLQAGEVFTKMQGFMKRFRSSA